MTPWYEDPRFNDRAVEAKPEMHFYKLTRKFQNELVIAYARLVPAQADELQVIMNNLMCRFMYRYAMEEVPGGQCAGAPFWFPQLVDSDFLNPQREIASGKPQQAEAAPEQPSRRELLEEFIRTGRAYHAAQERLLAALEAGGQD